VSPVNVDPTVVDPLTVGSVAAAGSELFADWGFLASPAGVPRSMIAKSDAARTFRNMR
jgi:hypothetical protein